MKVNMQKLIHISLLTLFTFGIASGSDEEVSDEVKAPQLDCFFTPALAVDAIRFGAVSGLACGAIIDIVGYSMFGIETTFPKLCIYSATGGITGAAITTKLKENEFKKLQEGGQRIATLHNNLNKMVSNLENDNTLNFAKFLLSKGEGYQSDNPIKNFSLESSKKLKVLYQSIKTEISNAYEYSPYLHFYNSHDNFNSCVLESDNLYRYPLDNSEIIWSYVGDANKEKIENFNQLIEGSRLNQNLKSIYLAHKTNVHKKILMAHEIQEKKHHLDLENSNYFDSDHLCRDEIDYINSLVSQYDKLEHNSQFNNLIPQVEPYVIPNSKIQQLLQNELHLDTIQPLEVESPLTVKSLENIKRIYEKDARRTARWQNLIRHCSQDGTDIIASTLFPQNSKELVNALNTHYLILDNKAACLSNWIRQANYPAYIININSNDILTALEEDPSLWRIHLPTTNIKGE